MADNLSPLVNLDLINKIYKTINAQITERVYDPQYNPGVALGADTSRYSNAYLQALNVQGDATISGNTSTGTLNSLTLTKKSAGFTISGGTTAKTLTVADTATITKSLEVAAATSIKSNLTVSAATNVVKGLTVGTTDTGTVTIKSGGTGNTTIVGPGGGTANLVNGTYTSIVRENFNTANTASTLVKRDQNGDISVSKVNGVTLGNSTASFTVTGGSATPKTLIVNSAATLGSSTTSENGSVTVKSAGTSSTTITGPNGEEAKLINGTYTTSATTENSIIPTENKLLKITKVDAKTFLAGPETGTDQKVPKYRTIQASDLPEAKADASGIVTTEAQTFEGAKTFNKTIIGNINGNAGTATKLETARSFKIADADSTNISAAGVDFDGTKNITLKLPATIKAALTGNADTASQVKTVKASTSTNHYISFVDSDNATATAETVYTSSKLTYNPSTGTLGATKLTGELGASNIAGTLGVEHGGTGINSFTAGDILYASGDTTLSVLGKGDKGQVLKMGENSPAWDIDNTPTTFKWTDGDTEGPTGSLSGDGMTDVDFAAIPSASESTSGIVTTGDQIFEGTKTFNKPISGSINGNATTLSLAEGDEDFSSFIIFQDAQNNTSKLTAHYATDFKYNPHSDLMDVGSVRLKSKVTFQYNSSTESLDFIFA